MSSQECKSFIENKLRKENIPVVLLTFMCGTFCQGTDFLGGFLQIVWFPPKLTAAI